MKIHNFLIPPVYAQCGGPNDPATIQCAEVIFGNIVSILTTVAGIAFFFMLIAAGFRYLTSSGDPKAVASAGNTLTWAIAGLVIVIVTWFILVLIYRLTGVEVTVFRIFRNVGL